MSASRKFVGYAVSAVCVTFLASCITNALWNWHDPDRVPDLHTTKTACRIESVHVPRGSDPNDPDALAVEFRPVVTATTPPHLQRYAEHVDGWLDLRRTPDVAAAQAHPLTEFRAASFRIDVFDGEHLRRATFNATVVERGEVSARDLGREVPARDVPLPVRTGLVRPNPGAGERLGLVRRALDGFDAQQWLPLLGGGIVAETAEQVPVGWRGRGDGFLEPEFVRDVMLGIARGDGLPNPAEIRLLGKLGGPRGHARWFEIPLPVLLNATDLQLERRGDVVRYAQRQRWRGRIVRRQDLSSDLVASNLPLDRLGFVYEYSQFLPTEEPLKQALISVLTPVAAVLDFAIMTSSILRPFYELFRETFPFAFPDLWGTSGR